MRVFPDEINIWIIRLSKADCPHQLGWAPSNQLSLNRTKGQRKGEFTISPPESGECEYWFLQPSNWDLHHWQFWFSDHQTWIRIYTINSPGLWSWTGTTHSQLSWLSSLQTADLSFNNCNKALSISFISASVSSLSLSLSISDLSIYLSIYPSSIYL